MNTDDKSCVANSTGWSTAISNNILSAGKHYVTFQSYIEGPGYAMLGVMRPGQADQNARGLPYWTGFYTNFSRTQVGHHNNNDVQCCMYYSSGGKCYTSNWERNSPTVDTWEGMESMSFGDELGMLLDLDEGTLAVYKNDRKLGVMKRGLAGQYCWVASMWKGTRVTIKRGTIPPS